LEPLRRAVRAAQCGSVRLTVYGIGAMCGVLPGVADTARCSNGLEQKS